MVLSDSQGIERLKLDHDNKWYYKTYKNLQDSVRNIGRISENYSEFLDKTETHSISFQTFFVWALKIVHEFFIQALQVVFHRSLSDRYLPHVSMTLLIIVADLDNKMDWIVLVLSLMSSSSSLFFKVFGNRPSNTKYNLYNYHPHVS